MTQSATSQPSPAPEPTTTPEPASIEAPTSPFLKHYRRGEEIPLDEATTRALVDFALDAYEKEQKGQAPAAPAAPAPDPAKVDTSDMTASEIRKLREEFEADKKQRTLMAQQAALQGEMNNLCSRSKFLQSEPEEREDLELAVWKLMASNQGRLPLEKAFQQAEKARQDKLARRDQRILGTKTKQAAKATEAAGGSGAPTTGNPPAKRGALKSREIMSKVAQRFREARQG